MLLVCSPGRADPPDLDFSTYLGGSGDDRAIAVSIDPTGAIVVAGETDSTDFPVVSPLQAYAGGTDAFVCRIDATGTTVLYATYLGGSGDDSARDVATNDTGSAFVVGRTFSQDFPLVNAYSPVPSGAFLTKLGPWGAFRASTYIDDAALYASDVGVDSTGAVVVSGRLPPDSGIPPAGYVYVKVLDPAATSLVWETTSVTWCDEYNTRTAPMTVDAADMVGLAVVYNQYGDCSGSDRVSVRHFATSGAGGSGTTMPYGFNHVYEIAVDSSGLASIAGLGYVSGVVREDGVTVPTTVPDLAAMAYGSGDNGHGVATRAGTAVVGGVGIDAPLYQRFFDGSGDDEGNAVSVGRTNDLLAVAGATTSTDFPTLAPLQAGNAGGRDAFVARLSCLVGLGDLPDPVIGEPYSHAIAADGGSPPYTFSLAAGSLPPGLALSPAGVVEGTPWSTGSSSFTVAVASPNGGCGRRTYVFELCSGLDLRPAAIPYGVVGQPYAVDFEARFGKGPATFTTSSSMPPGLYLDPSGRLSGTPTSPGNWPYFLVQATDAAGCTDSRSYFLRIHASSCATIAPSPGQLPDPVVGDAYAVQLGASGGAPPYRFSAYRPLPQGLSLSTSGLLSGVTTDVGPHDIQVIVRDDADCTAIASWEVAIGASLLAGEGHGPLNPNVARAMEPGGAPTPLVLMPYLAGKWGIRVASGQLDSARRDEILTGPGPGESFGPTVKAFRRDATAIAKVSFWAYGTLKYGVDVAAGDVEGDGFAEILTGAGEGAVFGPHVRAFDVDGGSLSAIGKVNFFAYSTLRYGVHVARGDVDADGYAEIVTGTGPGLPFAPMVRGFDYDGAALRGISKISFWAFPILQYGAAVAGGDVEEDGYAELAASPGPGPGPDFPSRCRAFDYDGNAVAPVPGFDVTPFSTTYGGQVGLGDVNGNGAADLLAGAGRDPAADATVRSFRYTGGTLVPWVTYFPFPGTTHGVNVAAADLGI